MVWITARSVLALLSVAMSSVIVCGGVVGSSTEIVSISDELVTNIGESAALNCTVNNPNEFTVTWTKKSHGQPSNNVALSYDTALTLKDPRFGLNITNDGTSYLLQIHNIEPSDAAAYECQIIMSSTEKVTRTVELLVRTPAKITSDFVSNPEAVNRGKTATLKCLANGYPRPTIYWQREHMAVLPGGGHKFNGNIMTIANVSKEDRGTYYCFAENGVGRADRQSVDFGVNFPPQISTPRPKVAQALNYDIELECRVEAYPPPAIYWIKNGKDLSTNSDYTISTTASADEISTSILRVHTIESKQYGDYVCHTDNKMGQAQTRINLFAQDVPDINYSGLRLYAAASRPTTWTLPVASIATLFSLLYAFN